MIRTQFVKFLFIGVLNTLFGYGMYVVFVFLGLNYVAASFFATVAGIVFNFHTIGKMVFKAYDPRLFGRFLAVYTITFVTGITWIWGFKHLGLNDYEAGFAALFPNAVIAFLLNKFYVFRKHDER